MEKCLNEGRHSWSSWIVKNVEYNQGIVLSKRDCLKCKKEQYHTERTK